MGTSNPRFRKIGHPSCEIPNNVPDFCHMIKALSLMGSSARLRIIKTSVLTIVEFLSVPGGRLLICTFKGSLSVHLSFILQVTKRCNNLRDPLVLFGGRRCKDSKLKSGVLVEDDNVRKIIF